MDTATIITSLISSGAVSLGAARWLTTHLIDHRLAKDLADHKAALDQRLAASKSELDRQVAAANAQLEATLRKGVEEYLVAIKPLNGSIASKHESASTRQLAQCDFNSLKRVTTSLVVSSAWALANSRTQPP